jgi:hypothetical protein
LDPKGELSKRIINEIRWRVKMSDREYEDKRNTWRKADETMVAYVPESAEDARRRNKRENQGDPKYTTIRVPYAYGVVMALHSYFVAAFLSRSPVFQFEGYEGEGENQVMALEALYHYQYNVGVMGPALFSWIYDTPKYGVGILGDYWTKTVRHVCHMEPLIDPTTGEIVDVEQVVEEVMGYEGNQVFNVSPFDVIPDPTVALRDLQKGEFFGTRQRLSYQLLKEREAQGYYTNVDAIDPRIVPTFPTDTDRDRNSRVIQRPSEDLFNLEYSTEDTENRVPGIVPVYEMFVNIIPSKWGLGETSYPCKWVFTVTGDWKTVIGAAPFGAYHAEYPFSVNEMEFDAHSLTNRGLTEITDGIGNTMDWLFNSRMFNVRASLNNLFLVDPLRVNIKDLTDPMPGGIIRRRAGASISGDKAVEQLMINDVTRTNVSDMQLMQGLGEKATGIGDLLMGSAPQGGRRTATESRGQMAAGTSRGKTITEYMSAAGWASLGRHTVANAQQYYDGYKKLKIVGSQALQAGRRFIEIHSAEDIAGHYGYLMVDGSLPIDRFAQLNVWKDLMTSMAGFPEIMAQYDVARIFAWVAQLGGLRNVNNFRLDYQDPVMLAQQAQQGNIVPLKAPTDPDMARQMNGVGPVQVGGTGVG